jgi:hypothetical protein
MIFALGHEKLSYSFPRRWQCVGVHNQYGDDNTLVQQVAVPYSPYRALMDLRADFVRSPHRRPPLQTAGRSTDSLIPAPT